MASSQKTTQLLAGLSLTEEDGDDGNNKLSDEYLQDAPDVLKKFSTWSNSEKVDFIERAVIDMDHYQLGHIDHFIRPMLKRDFITNLPANLAEMILFNVDANSLKACEDVSVSWRYSLARGMHWKKLLEKNVRTDALWKGLSEKRHWDRFLNISRELACQRICENYGYDYQTYQGKFEALMLLHVFYRKLYPKILSDINTIDINWRRGNYKMSRINCRSENSKGVYCLQYDDEKIVSGLRDNTIKIWDRKDNSCSKVLSGHTGSVLCLQYDSRVIISGSSDATVRIWDVETGECLKTLIHHCEAVLHLRFSNGIMVTCSKDRSIAVWDMVSPREINIRRVLVGHRAAVNVVDFDDRYIVSASGDRTIKVWSMDTLEFVRTLAGHRRGIACLQYRGRLVVSGSSDNTIRLWDIHSGVCLRVLEGHEELVRCIRFDEKRIVSGAYDGKIKIWDLQAALDPRSMQSDICLSSLVQHTGRVFRLQFDDFQIVSSSHDDTILIWDFLNADGSSQNAAQMQVLQQVQQQQLFQHPPLQPQGDNAHLVPANPAAPRLNVRNRAREAANRAQRNMEIVVPPNEQMLNAARRARAAAAVRRHREPFMANINVVDLDDGSSGEEEINDDPARFMIHDPAFVINEENENENDEIFEGQENEE
ncbi:unnamed protein product [Caenorhabditis bovis]|uniref:F-box domain-containing protein n=1 Tax=Caenorhabditis bovis TaxID=2654633 RepID=A0A8S1ESX8_9PELO|nr:unnamed protein product [Caenorhabditis bovis]